MNQRKRTKLTMIMLSRDIATKLPTSEEPDSSEKRYDSTLPCPKNDPYVAKTANSSDADGHYSPTKYSILEVVAVGEISSEEKSGGGEETNKPLSDKFGVTKMRLRFYKALL
ncbi:unnamed protein product [Microthlaspi erraticum]|uniref:Uncharacterized protein n=1 Tax=Microthlaspi erraticum TaxID=1685480 RepID=A0A6D2HMS6_9BRAS|nr:unnamed protein product [Microthlaspi erraticum]